MANANTASTNGATYAATQNEAYGTPHDGTAVLSIAEAAERLCVSERMLQTWLATGAIPGGIRTARGWRVPARQIVLAQRGEFADVRGVLNRIRLDNWRISRQEAPASATWRVRSS